MRKETRAVKKILKHYYPETKFGVKIKDSYSVEVADKMIVECAADLDADEVVKCLCMHTEGICIYKQGEPIVTSESEEAKIILPKKAGTIDGELLGLIEVRKTN